MHKKWIGRGIIGLFFAGALIALYYLNPAQSYVFIPCPVHYITGMHCPGCGALRGSHNLLNGQIGAAFAMNPLMVISIPFLGFLLLKPSFLHKPWVPWVTLGILLGFGLLRNIPFYPFTLLAPH